MAYVYEKNMRKRSKDQMVNCTPAPSQNSGYATGEVILWKLPGTDPFPFRSFPPVFLFPALLFPSPSPSLRSGLLKSS